MAINRRLTDISKTRLHLDLASPGEGYEGAVIVKTNLNNGGAKERRLADPWRWGWRRAARHLVPVARRDLRAWSDLAWLGALDYPIYDRVSLVPDAVWTNPHLVVQKFQPERNGDGRYRLRSWYVLGDRGFHVLTSASEPIVRGSNILAREVVDIETPPELVSLRTEMAVDFGRFDYVLAGGRAVIFDVNRTPASSPGAIKCYAREWREMAAGIDAFWK